MADRSVQRPPVLISENKALEILKITKASLRRLARQGLITCVSHDRGRVRSYYYDQIADYAELGRNYGSVNLREQLAVLLCEQRQIRRQLYVLAHHLGLPHLVVAFTDTQLGEIYEAAVAHSDGLIGTRRPDMAFVDAWLRLVPRLGVFEYRTMRRLYPHDANPWIHFYRVTEDLATVLTVEYDCKKDREYGDRYRQMLLCWDIVQKAAHDYMMIEAPWKKPEDSVTQALALEETPAPELIDPRIYEASGARPRMTDEDAYEKLISSVPRAKIPTR